MDFISHLRAVENRLDQLVELTKSVAIIQTQAGAQAEQMIELRTQMRSSQDKLDTSISRLHTRIDEMAERFRSQHELFEKESEAKVTTVENKHEALDKEFHYYLNRGLGAWALFSFLIGGAGWLLNKSIEALEREKTQIVSTVQNLKSASETNDVRITQIINKVQDLDDRTGKRH